VYCQECHERPASLHFTKIINGEKTEFHICEQCAKEKGEVIPGSTAFSIHHLLSGLLNFEQPFSGNPSEREKTSSLKCTKCGMTYSQFTKTGRFGCSNCYTTFNEKLNPIFKKIHSGNTTHSGKIPKRIGDDLHEKRKLKELKQTLQQLISKEEFEEAAILRDQIRSLENKLKEKGEES
jgi:protein arginine kinase activator